MGETAHSSGRLAQVIEIPAGVSQYDWEIPQAADVLSALRQNENIGKVYYDPFNDRIRILSKPHKKIQDVDIMQCAQRVLSADRLKKVKKIPENDAFYSFAIEGIADVQDVDEIINILQKKKAYIKTVGINFSTRALTLVLNIDKNKLKEFVDILNISLKEKAPNKKFNIVYDHSWVVEDKEEESEAKRYFNNAWINIIFVILLKLAMPWIPLPLTLGGQLIGCLLGGVTLGVMWRTGRNFYREAWEKLSKEKGVNMYTLVALGTGSAWLYSMVLVFFPSLLLSAVAHYEFISASMTLGIINFGKGMRCHAQERAANMIKSIREVYVNSQPQLAKKVEMRSLDLNSVHYQEGSYRAIREGDIVLVHAGERFPVDGIMVSRGQTVVEQAAITGESTPVSKARMDFVHSGSYNKEEPVLVQASCAGENSGLARLFRETNICRTGALFSSVVDKVARAFVPSILLMALLSALGWIFFGPVPQISWVIQSVRSVLLCACPCAMGLSLMAFSIGEYKALLSDIIIKREHAIEELARVKKVVFDKTGTLTTPVVHTVSIDPKVQYTETELLLLSASVERGIKDQEHPIALSLIRRRYSQELLPCTDLEEYDYGVVGTVTWKGVPCQVAIGNKMLLSAKNIFTGEACQQAEKQISKAKMTSTYVAVNGVCVGVLGLKHTLCEEAKSTVENLKKMNIDIYLLTGDKKGPAFDTADQLGILRSNVGYEKTIEAKRVFVENLKKSGQRVAVVGDGFNDTLAFREADVSIAVGTWTKASSRSDIVLRHLNIGMAIVIARETMKTIHQNLAWTFLYNTLSLIAATGLLFPFFGWTLNPIVACVSMAFSSIFVIFNSCRLYFDIDHQLALMAKKYTMPTTWWGKCWEYLPFKTLIQTAKMFFSMLEKNHTPVNVAYSTKAIFTNPPKEGMIFRKASCCATRRASATYDNVPKIVPTVPTI